MTAAQATELSVSIDIEGGTRRLGTAYVTQRRGAVTAVVDYAADYQRDDRAYAPSPDLPLLTSTNHTVGLPGAFADSAPDRWGRNLITRQARSTSRSARQLREVDFLLGVSDLTRQGALRFSQAPASEFVSPEVDVPPLIELPRLLDAADLVARDPQGGDELAAVKTLLDAGSGSLGGARPKASVRDGDDLMIAKFPHPGDEWDVMAWEKTALDLAERAGIPVPGRRLVDVQGRPALVLDRFDRVGARRVGYLSAMSLVGGVDGGSYDYLEVAEALTEHGSKVSVDLRQLWRRVAFSLIVNNTDDHLRNHGFLRAGNGWRLSPCFDVNPDPDPTATSATSVGFAAERHARLEALMTSSRDFALTSDEARRVWDEVRSATSDWRAVAAGNGIGDREVSDFADAFDGLRAVML